MDYIGVTIYIVGFWGWLLMWKTLLSYQIFCKMKLLYITFFGCIFVLLSNCGLSLLNTIGTYDYELQVYPYVETNAKTISTLSLSIAVFIVLRISSKNLNVQSPTVKFFLWLVFWSFLISTIGCLSLFWMPSGMYWLTYLRHAKTVVLTYSIFLLASGIVVFLYEIGFNPKDDIESIIK